MRKIIFATNNAHKLSEVAAILGPDYELTTPADHGITEEIPELEKTLRGNALAKARYIHQRTGLDCFADDTGLEVAALHGEPGVHSARYAGPGHDAAANMALLLKNMDGVKNRRAKFHTVVALILGGKEHTFDGEVRGWITTAPSGAAGFGYDPVFMPDGHNVTFAEMPAAEKNAISHRAHAIRRLATYLKKH